MYLLVCALCMHVHPDIVGELGKDLLVILTPIANLNKCTHKHYTYSKPPNVQYEFLALAKHNYMHILHVHVDQGTYLQQHISGLYSAICSHRSSETNERGSQFKLSCLSTCPTCISGRPE